MYSKPARDTFIEPLVKAEIACGLARGLIEVVSGAVECEKQRRSGELMDTIVKSLLEKRPLTYTEIQLSRNEARLISKPAE